MDAPAKTRGWSFGVSRKSEIRYFSAVAAQGSSLKIPDIIFFEIHPKSGVVTFGRSIPMATGCPAVDRAVSGFSRKFR